MKPTAQLYNFVRHVHSKNGKMFYTGFVRNDIKLRFGNGQLITTSEVIKETDNYIVTLNSVYELVHDQLDISDNYDSFE